jgi:hypothetical protein
VNNRKEKRENRTKIDKDERVGRTGSLILALPPSSLLVEVEGG